jgi:hypothetical protein
MKISLPEGASTFRRTAKGRESKPLSPASIGRSWLTFKDAQNENIRERTGSVLQETKVSMDLSSLGYNAFVLKHVLDVLDHSTAGADCYAFEAMSTLWGKRRKNRCLFRIPARYKRNVASAAKAWRP